MGRAADRRTGGPRHLLSAFVSHSPFPVTCPYPRAVRRPTACAAALQKPVRLSLEVWAGEPQGAVQRSPARRSADYDGGPKARVSKTPSIPEP